MNPKEHFSAIILAAGLSSRMGRSKQLIEVNGLSMLDHAIQAALIGGIEHPVVVLGHNANEIQSQTRFLHNCKVVINETYRSGMSTSLKCGIRAAARQTHAYVFMHADQPLVNGGLLKELLEGYEKKEADILYPQYQGRRGNPVIISSKLRERLLEASGDSGARFLFSDDNLKIVNHPVSTAAILTDIDTPLDLQLLTRKELFSKDRRL